MWVKTRTAEIDQYNWKGKETLMERGQEDNGEDSKRIMGMEWYKKEGAMR